MFGLSKSGRGADLYIDLGTANTLVVVEGRGLVVNEPSVVAYQHTSSGKKNIIAVGTEAKEKLGRAPGNLIVTHPLIEGVIADLDITEAMLKYFMEKPGVKKFYKRPVLVISLPYGVTDVERKAAIQAGISAGARSVYLIDEPMASAVGAGLKVSDPRASMVVDIGGGTTEVAVISLYGIVHCEAVRIGGHSFDRDILKFVKDHFNLIIGNPTAEKAKKEFGSAYGSSEKISGQIKGIDSTTGLPKSIDLTSHDLLNAIDGSLNIIIRAIHKTLEQIPPELVADIIQDGIVLTGGGSLLRDLDERLRKEIKVPIRKVEDPLRTIAQGGLEIIASKDFLERVKMS